MVILSFIYSILLCANILIGKKQRQLFYLITAFVLSGFAFFIRVDPSMDLYRHYITLLAFRKHGLSYFQTFAYSDSLFLYGVYFYLISLLQFDGFLPFITYFIVFFCVLKILRLLSEEFHLSKDTEQIGYFFCVSSISFLDLSGIRNFLVFALACYALVQDIVFHKNLQSDFE